MAEPTVDLRVLQGNRKGLVVPFTKSAAEQAVATGYAEYVTPEAPPEVAIAEEPELEDSAEEVEGAPPRARKPSPRATKKK